MTLWKKRLLSKTPFDMFGRLALLYFCIRVYQKFRFWSRQTHQSIRSGAAAGDPEAHHLYKRNFIMNQQGLWLFTKQWLPDSSITTKGLIFIVHGLGEHIDRYDAVAELLTSHGYAVFGMDHQGHGRSDGDRVFVEEFQHMARDYFEFIQKTLLKTDFKTLPKFLLGHSMGGAISLSIVELSKEKSSIKWNGIILSGPALKADPSAASPFVVMVAKIMSSFLPHMSVAELDRQYLSRDPHVVASNERDPLNATVGVTARLAKELLDAMQNHLQNAALMKESLLILHGSDDKIVMPQGSAEYYHECKSQDVQLKVYPNLYHEIFHSPELSTILSDMINWMEDRL